MRQSTLVVLAALAALSCSSRPTAPTPTTQSTQSLFGAASEGGSSTQAITVERMRLRRVGGADIMTTLATGQVIEVPLNVDLDIWAEVRRVDGDRAPRLKVNWGNGNEDFAGCGPCSVPNRYTREGRYVVTAQLIDLNAPFGTPPIQVVTVTLDVFDPGRRISCSAVGTDFESSPSTFPTLGPSLAVPGITFSGTVGVGTLGVDYSPLARLNAITSTGPMTLTFDSDKNFATIGYIALAPATTVAFQAFDASGNLVTSGSVLPTASFPGLVGDFVNVSGVVFRRIVLTVPTSAGSFVFDNISAGCR
jgi:hypothetical protein